MPPKLDAVFISPLRAAAESLPSSIEEVQIALRKISPKPAAAESSQTLRVGEGSIVPSANVAAETNNATEPTSVRQGAAPKDFDIWSIKYPPTQLPMIPNRKGRLA